MKKRPLSVTVIGWIYIATGVGGIAAHVTEIHLRYLFETDVLLPLIVRLLAILSGVFMLRGSNWGRRLAVAWIGYHVVLSSFFSLRAAVLHALLFAVFTYFLFRRSANAYFRDPRAEPLSP
jgi:hypothetical protein